MEGCESEFSFFLPEMVILVPGFPDQAEKKHFRHPFFNVI